jgi:L-malate glycosyltransferase
VNILIIDNSIAFTGAFKCALNEAAVLSAEHQVIFLLPTGSQVAELARLQNHTVYTLPLKEISKSWIAIVQYPFALLRNLKSLRKIVREEKVDVVQVNDFYNLLGAALKFTGYRGKLLTYVRFLPSVMPGALRKFWIGLAQRYSSRVIAVSDAVLKELPAHPSKIRVYDPVLLAEQHPQTSIPQTDTTTLLYLANFTRGKGQEHAIEAFYHAYRQHGKLKLKFVGGDMGLPKNVQFREELKERVQQLGLASVISFENFTADVEQEIKNATVVLNFSEAESFSMTCLEASFYGRPVIATRCGGPEEIVVHHQTGYLLEKRDVAAMTEAILALATSKELCQSMGNAGRNHVREKFSVDNFKRTFSEILS